MTTKNQTPVRVRFAPSPTGRTHLGSGRTALYNYLLARQTGGQFILRIEDTDQKRYVEGAEEELMQGLRWLGMDWDEGPDVGGDYGPYRQTERRELYAKYARELIENRHAYYCFCTAKDEGQEDVKKRQQHRDICPSRDADIAEASQKVAGGAAHVIRYKMPKEGSITVEDALRGEITVENATLDDYILVKSDGLPVYHLAVVVDDHLMGITHAIRTSEWLPTFPLHGHIYAALGWEQPTWIHPSIFLKPDGKGKMSKRDSEALMEAGKPIFLSDFGKMGYLPEAVVNWAALIGWSYDDKTEEFTLDELIEKFSVEKLSPSPAALNFTKLDHFNGVYIRAISSDDLAERIKPFFEEAGCAVSDSEKLLRVATLLQVRLKNLTEAPAMGGFFFKEDVFPEAESLIGKKMDAESALVLAREIEKLVADLPDFSMDSANQPFRVLAAKMDTKVGNVFGFLRDSLTAQKVSPPIFDTMEIIGREKVLERIRKGIELLEAV
ncbi:MAG: glutamate--tRNA ligase [Anaerolineae bacterium]|jgi:glutamyl-tRNA synthetase|nr:glutamate--tRNA ligase [Anaerolineae bacterium]MBT4310537.1 glutamate--tRNA ligase [Anaerolineae bacterium]MBT4457406.1 glutamate--tRNA ligase [Anaerolineae bacterium]MBT6060468.1 glutamate--tRNA ligase [Anaerolineae bacterium]MBT6323239.1 glutamate--tRNA ligase [Anaerolineae bacterium]